MDAVAGVNHQLRLDIVQMCARIFHDTVVIFLERPLAFDRDDGIHGYPGRYWN